MVLPSQLTNRTLLSFEKVGSGSETAILPPCQEMTRQAFVPFPVSSSGLTPCSILPTEFSLPRVSLFHFDEATLHGFRLFDAGGALFNDHSLVDPTDHANSIFWRQFRPSAKEEGCVTAEDVVIKEDGSLRSTFDRMETLDGTDCLILCSAEPANFGSWMFRFLPKLMVSSKSFKIRRAFGYQYGRWMLPILQLFEPSIEVVPHNPVVSYRIKNALVPSLPAPSVYYRPELRDGFAEIAARVDTHTAVPERLYVSRRKQAINHPSYRVLENETELFEVLRTFGFTEFFPEDHPISHQISVFAKARLIISVGGSNLFCAAFAQKADFILDIESQLEWLYAHTNLLASTGRPFSIVQGVRNERGDLIQGNWTIDVQTLVAGLRAMNLL